MRSASETGTPFGNRRSATPQRWSRAPIIDGEAWIVSRSTPSTAGFPSSASAARSGPARGDAPSTRSGASTRRTLLWTAPVAVAVALLASAILTAPDRTVAEPDTRAALRTDSGAL